MNPTFPPMITYPPPQERFGGIYVTECGKTQQESRVKAVQAMLANGDRSHAFLIRPLDSQHIAVLTKNDMEEELNRPKKLEVIA